MIYTQLEIQKPIQCEIGDSLFCSIILSYYLLIFLPYQTYLNDLFDLCLYVGDCVRVNNEDKTIVFQ